MFICVNPSSASYGGERRAHHNHGVLSPYSPFSPGRRDRFRVDLTEGNLNGKKGPIDNFFFTRNVPPDISSRDEYRLYRQAFRALGPIKLFRYSFQLNYYDSCRYWIPVSGFLIRKTIQSYHPVSCIEHPASCRYWQLLCICSLRVLFP